MLKKSSLLLMALSVTTVGALASNWVPISVGDITTFVPNPQVENLETNALEVGASVSIEVGSTNATEAYYYREFDVLTGQYGAWQCQTASTVAQQGDKLIIDEVLEGQYQYQVSACMTGNGCDVASFESGNLACSENVMSAKVEVLDTGSVQQPSPSSTRYDYIGGAAGEFRVSESGAATYNVPFSLPKGTAGVEPSLGLSYASNSGDGIAGIGWHITGVSAISRCPKNFEQDGEIDGVKIATSDRLCLDGQRLVTNGKANDKGTSDSTYWNASRRYHTELDSFSLIRPYYSGSVLKAFTVETKSGEVHYYGEVSKVSGTSQMGVPLKTTFKDAKNITDTGADAFVKAGTSTSHARTWSLKAIKDVKGNYILFKYNKNTALGQHSLAEIQYTGNVSSSTTVLPYNSVLYSYKTNTKPSAGYMAGHPVSNDKLLDKVVISADKAEYRTYKLSYHTSDFLDERNNLEAITECVGSSCKKPLTFEWQKKPEINVTTTEVCVDVRSLNASSTTERECVDTVSQPTTDPFKPFTTTPVKRTSASSYDRVFDFNGDGYSDIVYLDGSSWKVKYGPSYGSPVSLGASQTDNKENTLILDVDGDGVLDLLFANNSTSFWRVLSSKKQFLASNNSCPDGINHPACNYTVSVNSHTTNVKAIGIDGAVQVLDVDGDTLGDIVFAVGNKIQYYRSLGTGNFESAKTIIELNKSDSTPLFERPAYEQTASMKNASALDVNGDGRSDLIFRERENAGYCDASSFFDQITCADLGGEWFPGWRYHWRLYISEGNGTFTEKQLLSTAEKFNFYVTDLNGDGLSDLLVRNAVTWFYRLSNGVDFNGIKELKTVTGAKFPVKDEYKGYATFVDVSQDGRTDLLVPNSSGTSWRIMFTRVFPDNPDHIVVEQRGFFNYDENRSIQFGDANGDGKLDLFQSDSNWYVNYAGMPGQPENVIKTFTTATGVETEVNYSYIGQRGISYLDVSTEWDTNGSPDKNYFSPKSGIAVVSTASTQTTANDVNTVRYEYGGLLVNKNGRGMLGFQRLRTRDLQTCATEVVANPPTYDPTLGLMLDNGTSQVTNTDTCMTTETVYKQRFPYTGMPLSTTQTLGVGNNAIIVSHATNEFDKKTTANGGIFPYIKNSTEKGYALNAGLSASSATSETNSNFNYDAYGNMTSSTVYERDAANRTKNYRLTETTNVFNKSVLYETFGRLEASTVTKRLYQNGSLVKHNGDDGVVTRKSKFTYDSSLLLATETANDDVNAYKLVTTHEYDGFGNKIKQSTVGAAGKGATNSQTRSSSTQFDARGQYAVKSINALGHTSTTTVSGNKGTGKGVIKQVVTTGANGTTTTQKFDVFGQVKETHVTAGDANAPTLVSKQYPAYCASSGASCDTDAFPTAYYRLLKSAPGKPESQAFYDRWGREVGMRTKAFDGSWTTTATTYNSDGQPLHVYEPHKNGLSPYKTVYTYDRLRRVVEENLPRGKITRGYNGLTTTTTNQNGLVQNETKDYLGQLAAVITLDADNKQTSKLTYQYSANNELLKASVYSGNTFSHVQVTNRFDDYGHKIWMKDLDKGTWTYTFNAFGEMVEQKNSSNQVTYLAYDKAGRKTSRRDNDGFTHWKYDQGAYSKGKLSEVAYYKGKSSASGTPNYREKPTYSYMGLVAANDMLIDGESFRTEHMYDKLNRPYYTKYPANNFVVKQTYSSTGFPLTLENATYGHRDYGKVYERITKMNHRGQVTEVQLANGLKETKNYEAETGWASYLSVAKGSTNPLHSLVYSYDDLGNLSYRDHAFALGSGNNNYYENFYYDGQNRLDHRDQTINGRTTRQDYKYDRLGNITYKQGTGHYFYDGTVKNRLSSVYTGANKTGTRKYNFSYDSRGNVTNDGSRVFKYTAFDKPYQVTKGAQIATNFSYDAARQLYRQVHQKDGKTTDTLYVKGMYQRTQLPSGVTEHKYMVGAAVVTDRSNGDHDTLYTHKDHLGSTVSITDSAGKVVQHFNYDAWGKQNAFGSHSMFATYSSPGESNGYTGHKMMNDIDIVHMGGRIYDANLGRFLQADPHIQAPKNSQNYNRYSYVLNNPMSYTDPSGYFFKKLWQKTSGALLRAIAKVPILNAAVQIGLGIACGPAAAVCMAAYSTAQTYALTGSLGAALRSGAISYATSSAFKAIGGKFTKAGGFFDAGVKNGFGHIMAHAAVGGVSAVLQGGKFGHGFFSAGITKGLTPHFEGIGGSDFEIGGYNFAEAAIAGILGGTISRATGGKFANGAVTAAMGNLFNNQKSRLERQRRNRQMMESLLKRNDVQGMLAEIRKVESNGRYDAVYDGSATGGTISLDAHPCDGGACRYKASGAYQITGETWGDIELAIGNMDFSHHSQDLGATWLLYKDGVIPLLDNQNFGGAIHQASFRWDALPNHKVNGMWRSYFSGGIRDSREMMSANITRYNAVGY